MPLSNLENVAKVFNDYDKEKMGHIDTSQLDPAYKTLGLYLDKTELNNIVSQLHVEW